MGSFVFIWPNAGEEVYVTGTFDNWSKTMQLDKVGDVFQKSVELQDASKKIYYKFVVDDKWVLDPAAPQERDEEGNINNVLTPENIIAAAPVTSVLSSAADESNPVEPTTALEDTPVTILPVTEDPPVAAENPASAAFLSSAAPASTTAQLAGIVPLEEKKVPTVEREEEPSTTDVAAPVTATAAAGVAAAGAAVVDTTETIAEDAKNMSGSAAEDLPGAFPATPASELNREVKLINPLPTAPGGVNPITLAPGEKVPDSLRTGDINANVKLDPESYEKADAAIAGDFSVDKLPPVSDYLIPESSLPIVSSDDFGINLATPGSTTAALAGTVPLEKDTPVESTTVPEVVKESQEAAGVDPEASAIPAEVQEKEQVEQELLQKVPEVPAAAESQETTGSGLSTTEVVGGVAAAAAGFGAAALATATSAKDKVVEQATPAFEKATAAASATANDAATKLPVSVKQVLPTAIQEQIASTSATGGEPVVTGVPTEVKASIQEAGTSPEAASNPVAVEEKKAVEAELLKTIDSSNHAEAEPVTPSAPASAVPATESATTEGVPASTAPNGKDAPSAFDAAPAPATFTNSTSAPHSTVAGNSTTSAAASASSKRSSKAGISTSAEKKKHRISGFFHKIMDKIDGDKKK
ncbi:Cruciform DNA binding protein [Sporothrix epigloea]|uniref:Cruciform DNA binding protein n=1 Tax=Sporothrix epigloea TaxID=1892477 RepID=A0ABP0DQF0_9PEZI